MKTIKWLWSITFAFMIVLFYATLTSLFLTPNSGWYISLVKDSTIPLPIFISIGWTIAYILTIVILTKLIYAHDNMAGIGYMVVIGVLQIIWSAVFFAGECLIGGLIIELAILIVSALSYKRVIKENVLIATIYAVVIIWYIIVTIFGYNIWLVNH